MFDLPNVSSNVEKVVVDEATIEENKPPLLVAAKRQEGLRCPVRQQMALFSPLAPVRLRAGLKIPICGPYSTGVN